MNNEEIIKFFLTEKDFGKRLDEVAFSYGLSSSRSKVQQKIKNGDILVNNRKEKPHYIVRFNDFITYKKITNNLLEIKKEDFPIPLIYEDEDLLIVNKPRGLVVHPGNGHYEGTLVNALLYRYGSSLAGNDTLRPGIVHRIDKDTTGLLAIAKSEIAFASLSEQLRTHSMHREYLALVNGTFPKSEGKIDAPIGRKKNDPIRFAVTSDGKEAITTFKVEETFGNSYSLLRCSLFTGRTHQIRVHMDFIHHPVEGDPLYGKENHRLFQNGQLLHAEHLFLKHPKTGEEKQFYAPLPDDFEEVLTRLRSGNF